MRRCLAIITALSISWLNGQFTDVRVTVDVMRLKERDRRATSTLANEATNLFKLTRWDEEYGNLEISLNLQFIFEGVADKGSEHLYSAQCLISTGIDQRYFSKGIQFPYVMGQTLVPSPLSYTHLTLPTKA